ncbi:hypothetical protein KGH46_12305, partial [Bacteroides thetaiotaomicron]|uniref:hypothetical protein n=1 Tax=Bacteroides thetaiotaomicron TaxID=818 RepID=UPI001CE24207
MFKPYLRRNYLIINFRGISPKNGETVFLLHKIMEQVFNNFGEYGILTTLSGGPKSQIINF